jgi:hypothetical protein
MGRKEKRSVIVIAIRRWAHVAASRRSSVRHGKRPGYRIRLDYVDQFIAIKRPW